MLIKCIWNNIWFFHFLSVIWEKLNDTSSPRSRVHVVKNICLGIQLEYMTLLLSYAHLVWETCVCPLLVLHKTKRGRDREEGKNCPGVFDGNILSGDHESERLDSIRKRTALPRGSMCVLSQVPVTRVFATGSISAARLHPALSCLRFHSCGLSWNRTLPSHSLQRVNARVRISHHSQGDGSRGGLEMEKRLAQRAPYVLLYFQTKWEEEKRGVCLGSDFPTVRDQTLWLHFYILVRLFLGQMSALSDAQSLVGKGLRVQETLTGSFTEI